MSRGLIGSTGFIGTSLQRQTRFDAGFHSTDIEELRGRTFDQIICAGAPAAKWKVNKEPEADLANMKRLTDVLATVRTPQFVLISTVDVYGAPLGVTEDTPVDPQTATYYGKHRRLLEEFCEQQFGATVIRLPGLFGTGLRKNVIFDLLHNNNVDQIHPEGVFQYYNTDRLWQDIERILALQLKLVHVSAEPVKTQELARLCFGVELPPKPAPAPARYDLRSKYAAHWGGTNGYLFSRDETLQGIREFVQRSRGHQP